jgi:hypothetical protein
MNVREHDMVTVTEDVPAENLQAGDTGAVVHIYRDGLAIVVEFTKDDDDLHLADLTPEQVRVVWSAAERAGVVANGS